MRHQCFKLMAIDAADHSFMCHHGLRVANQNDGVRTGNCLVFDYLETIDMAFSNSDDLSDGVMVNCNPRFDQPAGRSPSQNDSFAYSYIINVMTKNSCGQFDNSLLGWLDIVVNIQPPDPAASQRKIRAVLAGDANLDAGFGKTSTPPYGP